MKKFIVMSAGCAECGDRPLITIEGGADTLEEAKALSGITMEEWIPHEQGGVYQQYGSGSVWVIPIENLEEQINGIPS
jgi:hypothetical protein